MRKLTTIILASAILALTACRSGSSPSEDNNAQMQQDSMNNSVINQANDLLKDTTTHSADSTAVDSNSTKTR